MVRRVPFLLLGLMIVTIFAGASESRADPLPRPSLDDASWRFDFSLYGFAPLSVKGDSTVAGQTFEIDLDLSDLLDALDYTIGSRFEAWKGDYGLILDLWTVSLSGADGTVKSVGPLTLGAAVDVDFRQLYIDGMGSYRIHKAPYDSAGNLLSVEVMGGIRYNYLKQQADLKIKTGLGPSATTSLGGSESWVDPMLGTRVVASLSERWTAVIRADIGGFDISDTKLTWSINGGFDYRPWEKTSLKFGYRFYSIDFETTLNDRAFGLDADYHGPYFALTISFP